MQARNTGSRDDCLVNDTLALVLAGGNGSRLKTLTRWHAKPAIPFGGQFRTIDFTLSNCVHSGIRRIGILTQYKSYSLNCHIQRGWNFLNSAPGQFIELHPAQKRLGDNWYHGTADSVYQNLDIIEEHNPKALLVLAGDHIYNMDYGDLLAHHHESGADLTVGCIEVDREAASGFGVMSIDDSNRVRAFEEKPVNAKPMPNKPDRALASMGIYVFNTDFLKRILIQDARDPESSHDFGKDIIPGIIHQYHVNAYPFVDEQGDPSYWRDVGTVDSYWKTNMELLGPNPGLDIYSESWPIWTTQEQAPPAKFLYSAEYNCHGSAINSIVSKGCVLNGASVRESILFTGSSVQAGSSVSQSLLLPGARVGENCWLNRVVVDQNCDIPAGTVIGADIEQDAMHFPVTTEGVVLVSPESLKSLQSSREAKVSVITAAPDSSLKHSALERRVNC